MSRKSKSKDQTKALNIPFSLTQGDLVQEALAVTFAKDQIQALKIDEVDVLSQMISPSFTRLIKSSTTCVALHNIFHCDKNKLTPYLVGIVSVSQNISTCHVNQNQKTRPKH
jgi:hypothetical protein